MKTMIRGDVKELDAEWLELILTARQMGISKDEIRDFLKNPLSGTGMLQKELEQLKLKGGLV